MNLIDLTGTEFPNLTVLDRGEDIIKNNKKRRVRWHCRCKCGNEFDVISDNLKRRPNMTCNECAKKIRAEKQRVNRTGEKYGRLTILDIIPCTSPVRVKCKCDCGNYYIGTQADIVSGHTQSCGCLQKERASETNTKDWTGVISDCGIEFLRQDYMNTKGQWLWRCKCGICGNEFTTLPAKVIENVVTSCGCAVQSAAERYIYGLLKELNIEFVSQYSFEDCKDIYPLRFDFAIFENDSLLYLIEYDGRQHFEPIDWFGGVENFKKQQKRDNIKNNYCKLNNINLLRLPYTLSNAEIKEQIYEYHLSVTTTGCA